MYLMTVFGKDWLILIFVFSYLTVSECFAQETIDLGDSIVEIATKQLGVPYKYGKSSPNKHFDCSGFTYYVYQAVGIDVPRSSSGFDKVGKTISLEKARPGDCIVFSGTAKGSTTAGHVGIVVSNDKDGLTFIHSSSSKKHYGVVLTHYQTSGYLKRFLAVKRLF